MTLCGSGRTTLVKKIDRFPPRPPVFNVAGPARRQERRQNDMGSKANFNIDLGGGGGRRLSIFSTRVDDLGNAIADTRVFEGSTWGMGWLRRSFGRVSFVRAFRALVRALLLGSPQALFRALLPRTSLFRRPAGESPLLVPSTGKHRPRTAPGTVRLARFSHKPLGFSHKPSRNRPRNRANRSAFSHKP